MSFSGSLESGAVGYGYWLWQTSERQTCCASGRRLESL